MNTVTWQTLVPESRHDAVRAAIRAAFGAAEVSRAKAVTGGASGATTLRLDVDGHASLLRVEGARGPYRNPHQYTCMRIATEAGVAPPLRYFDEPSGIAIMDFIAAKPLAAYPGGPVELTRALGALRAKLQAGRLFPEFVDYRKVIRLLTERLQARFAPGLLDPHREGLERICATLQWDAATHVASHNDPNPRNILFDGERLWLVDWETAYRNDAFVDVAILADNLAQASELEDSLLAAWLGRAANAEDRQRLKVVRALTRLYYAGLLGTLVTPSTPVVGDLATPSREEFMRGIANGSLQFSSPGTRVLLVKISLAGFLELL
jgi:hypothetical protein